MANPSFVTKIAGVRLDRAALERITTSTGMRAQLRLYAEAVAESAVGTVGIVAGHPAEAIIYADTVTAGDSDALARQRVAVLMKHPSPMGRQAGAYALLAAIDQ